MGCILSLFMMKTLRQMKLVVQSTHSMPHESTPPRNGYMPKLTLSEIRPGRLDNPPRQVIPPIIINRPFYRCGGHIEFIRFKEYYGMPRGTCSVFKRAFRATKELKCIFLGKKAIIIFISKHGTTIFFSIAIFF